MDDEPQRIKIVRKSGTVITIYVEHITSIVHTGNRAEIRTVCGQTYYVTPDDEVHSFPHQFWWENNG